MDSHLLVWLAAASSRLPKSARDIIEDQNNRLFFSAASLWELSIKHATGRARLALPPAHLYEQLVKNEYSEVPVTVAHGLKTASLPPIHKDPFDRILIAQAMAEEMLLLTSDETMARYRGPIRLVR